MIPQKIHFCWFSDDPYSEIVEQCIASWKHYMPTFEIVKWDMNRIECIDSIWLKECLSVKKWAFATDFVRLWAIYHEGGIYLDSDVLLHGSLEQYCQEKMFIGREDVYYTTLDAGAQVFLTSHCFGAETGHAFVKLCLDYYQGRHFIASTSKNVPNELRYDMLMMPYIQCRLAEHYGYDARVGANHIQHLSNDVTVYPSKIYGRCQDSFWKFGSIAEHIGCGSWREPKCGYREENHGADKYTIGYKIRWRIKYLLDKFLAHHNYLLVKIHDEKK